jgi:hypothetical protein
MLPIFEKRFTILEQKNAIGFLIGFVLIVALFRMFI